MRFSYSKISCFKQCPYKFKLIYIDKLQKPVVNEALVKGSKIHELLENFENFDKTSQYSKIVLDFANSELGRDILSKNSTREWCVKFDENLNADDSLTQKSAKLIGYIDRINATENGIELIDFKTGKYKDPRWQDFEQLTIYSIYMFSKYPTLSDLKLRYVYVEHSKENSKIISRNEADFEKTILSKTLMGIENAKEYPKKPQKLCEWCEFKGVCKPSL